VALEARLPVVLEQAKIGRKQVPRSIQQAHWQRTPTCHPRQRDSAPFRSARNRSLKAFAVVPDGLYGRYALFCAVPSQASVIAPLLVEAALPTPPAP
jgi:hypothetical protein